MQNKSLYEDKEHLSQVRNHFSQVENCLDQQIVKNHVKILFYFRGAVIYADQLVCL